MTDEPTPPRGERSSAFELLVQNVGDYAIFLLDPTGHVRTWNRGAARLKGYAAEEIVGRHFSTFYTEPDRVRQHPQHELEIAERLGRYEEEGWRVRKDGSQFWANVVITAVRDEEGTLVGFGKVTRDLTARKLAEEQLRATATELRLANEDLVQFRRMVAGVRDYAIFMLDPGGHVRTWNAGAQNIKGWTADEIVGRHFSVFYTQEDRSRNHPADELEIAARTGRYEEEGWRVRKDGTLLWASVTITAVRDENGVLTGFSKVTRDLTERRAADQELRAARDELERANAELERFAVVAAHDLREPLTTIGSLVQLVVETEAGLGGEARAHLERVSDAVRGMHGLIEDLLVYARLGGVGVELEPVALAPVVERVLERLHGTIAARGAEVRTDVPTGAEVLVDRLGADLLLQNLLSNAVKFGAAERPAVAVSAESRDGGWRLEVRDDGAGIAEADRARIFRAFERVRGPGAPSGQGLGLSICQRVVERSGGRLGVESAPGRGSIFWAWLPEPDAA